MWRCLSLTKGRRCRRSTEQSSGRLLLAEQRGVLLLLLPKPGRLLESRRCRLRERVSEWTWLLLGVVVESEARVGGRAKGGLRSAKHLGSAHVLNLNLAETKTNDYNLT